MVFNPKLLWKVTLTIFLLLLLTSCGLGSAQKGRKPSPDWSRGVPLTVAVAGTADIAVAGNGEAVYLAWPTFLEDELVIHYMQLDETGEPIIDRNLDLPPGRARTPRLLLAGNGQLHLIWARRPVSSSGWELWQATVDADGKIGRASCRERV